MGHELGQASTWATVPLHCPGLPLPVLLPLQVPVLLPLWRIRADAGEGWRLGGWAESTWGSLGRLGYWHNHLQPAPVRVGSAGCGLWAVGGALSRGSRRADTCMLMSIPLRSGCPC